MNIRQILLTILNVISAFVGIVIGLRIVFLLLNANVNTPIVSWINNVSSSLIYPFQGLFGNIQLTPQSVVDVTAVIALLAYAILFSIIYRLIYYLTHNEALSEVHSHV